MIFALLPLPFQRLVFKATTGTGKNASYPSWRNAQGACGSVIQFGIGRMSPFQSGVERFEGGVWGKRKPHGEDHALGARGPLFLERQHNGK